LSSVAVHNKPSIERATGSMIVFIDAGNQLRTVLTSGAMEMVLSDQPVWWSVALSPDGNKLAATTTDFDGRIYVFDLLDPSHDAVYDIYSQNYGGEGNDAALYADFLEWSNDNQYVLYDAFNVAVTAGGDSIGYWDINLLRAADGNILRVFPPDPEINVGNPTFSPINDHVIAFDYFDADGVLVVGADLETGTVGIITNNKSSLGRPSFSPRADAVVYHYIENGASLWRVTLEADGVTGAGDDQQIATGGFDPVWFAVGSRPAVVLSALAVARTPDGAARLEWEARADDDFAHFRILRDAGDGLVERGESVTVPFERGTTADRWEFEDALDDLPAGVRAVRYAVQSVDRDGSGRVLGHITLDLAATPARFVRLAPNVPNPFNPATAIHFTLGRAQPARVEILDTAGRSVRVLWQGRAAAGAQARVWDGRDAAGAPVAAGVYFARLVADDGTRTRKLTLVQ
jgi:hypothetical protein